MKEQLISFDTAKLANNKGFLQWTEKRYNKKGTFNDSKTWSISAPTQSLLQKWLRETHNIHLYIIPTGFKLSKRFIPQFRFSGYEYKDLDFKTYEEALEKGLQEALNLI